MTDTFKDYITKTKSIINKTAFVNMKVLCERRQIPQLNFECHFLFLDSDTFAQAITRKVDNELKRAIQFNLHYIKEKEHRNLFLSEIVPHEVCHLVQHHLEFKNGFKHQGHGKLWYSLMKQLGYTFPRETISLEKLNDLRKIKS